MSNSLWLLQRARGLDVETNPLPCIKVENALARDLYKNR
jgi:hypothetical protein